MTVKGCGVWVASAMHKRPELRRSVRRRLATLFIFATAATSMGSLSSCGEVAKEDPAAEQQRELQQQVEQPEQTEPTAGEQTDRTVGENIQG